MEKEKDVIKNTCDFAGIRPIMVDLPWPDIQVRSQNQIYANLLSADYCGATSEMSAITQYINNENRLSGRNCPLARTILGNDAFAETGRTDFSSGRKCGFCSPAPQR